jgi:RNA polymerase sigma factor (sigma-70 family)
MSKTNLVKGAVNTYNGDLSEIHDLYKQHNTALLNYALKFFDPEEARDAVAQAFLSLMTYTLPIKNVQAFLVETIKHKRIDNYRHAQVIKRGTGELKSLQPESDNEIYQAQIRAHVQKHLTAAIEKLSPQRKKILTLAFFEGKENLEIAQMLGLSEQTVKNEKSTAVKFLSKTLDKDIVFLWLFIMLLR